MRKPLIAVGAVAVAAAAAALLMLLQQPQQRPLTTTTPTTTQTYVPLGTRLATEAPTPSEVVVSNPFGSSRDQSLTFNPQHVKVVLNVNNTVAWVNEDSAVHTVVSLERLFDYTLQPGQRITHVFTQPGIYRYTCSLHPWMTGSVEVYS
ncbi:MAG: cupredoxin domain-containing protein [Candidatus Caldarchaeum sp.]|nr:cupredoxin domain-containing protein [Candidatus Caldarchaeum sp.]MDW7977396.1 cupredoxin domain-containing protein [Candidatus Caldarchaeum sp.]